MDLIITASCLWSQRIFPSLPGSRLTIFLSRCKFSTLTTRQPMVEFYLLTFPRFPLRKKEHKSYCGKNRTYDFRTSRCAAYLLDHSGEELAYWLPTRNTCVIYIVLANPAACFLSSACKFHLIILSCDHGWIRSGSVNVRKQQQQQQQLVGLGHSCRHRQIALKVISIDNHSVESD